MTTDPINYKGVKVKKEIESFRHSSRRERRKEEKAQFCLATTCLGTFVIYNIRIKEVFILPLT